MSSRQQQRQQTLDLYRRAVQSFSDRHPKPLHSQIYHYASSRDVNQASMTWLEEARVMQFEWEAKAQKIVAEIRFPKPKGGSVKLSGTCSCSPGLESVTCQHTLMAMIRLRSLLYGSTSPEIEQILRGCDPSPVESLVSVMDNVLQREVQRKKAEAASEVHHESDEKPTRVSFRVFWPSSTYGHLLEVQIYEQTTLKSGNWSKGKQISWPSMRDRQHLFRSPQEKAFFKIVADQFGWNNSNPYAYYSYSVNTPSAWKLLNSLIGAGNVSFFNEPDRLIEITSGSLSFGSELSETGMRLAVLVGSEPIPATARFHNDRAHGVMFATERRLWLAPLEDQAIRELAEELHETRIEVPRAEAGPIVKRLAKLSEFARVQLPVEFQLGEIEADRRTYLELIPGTAAGLFVRMRARPEPDEHAALVFPGDEKLNQYVVSNEGYRKLIRDQDAERLQAVAISAELQLDRFPKVTEWDWRIATDDETLEFLGQLKDRQDARRHAVAAFARTREELPTTQPEQQTTHVLANVATTDDNLGGLADNSATDDLVVLWPKGAKMRVTSEITPSALRIEIEDHNDWFGIQGTIEVDGHQIPLLDLLSAMKSGREYIALGGGLWARISQEFQKRLRGLQDIAHQSQGKLEVDFTAAPVLNDLFDTQINLKACQAWRDVLKRMDDAREIVSDPPISLTAELRDYQVEGFRWLKRLSTWGAGACLADDMGLGKTVQALALLIERMEEEGLVGPPNHVGRREVLRDENGNPI